MENETTRGLLETIYVDYWTPKPKSTQTNLVRVLDGLDDEIRKAMISRLKGNHPDKIFLFRQEVKKAKEALSMYDIITELREAMLIILQPAENRPPVYNGLVEGLLLIGKAGLARSHFKRVPNTSLPSEFTTEDPRPRDELGPGKYWTTNSKNVRHGTLIYCIGLRVGLARRRRMRECLNSSCEGGAIIFSEDDMKSCKDPTIDSIMAKLVDTLRIDPTKRPPMYDGLVIGLKEVGLNEVIKDFFEPSDKPVPVEIVRTRPLRRGQELPAVSDSSSRAGRRNTDCSSGSQGTGGHQSSGRHYDCNNAEEDCTQSRHRQAERSSSFSEVNPSIVYTSRHNPKNPGAFAKKFGDNVSRKEVEEIANYLFLSSDYDFGRTIVSADDLQDYEDGVKNARHLVRTLIEQQVILKLSDGTLDCTGLARILVAVEMHDLCARLLQEQPQ